MPDDDVDREIERLAGVWRDDEGETLVVAVTGEPGDVARALPPPTAIRLRLVGATHSLRHLEGISGRVLNAADELSAPLAAVGVLERENDVEAAPASVVLRERFAGEPVAWVQGRVEAAEGYLSSP